MHISPICLRNIRMMVKYCTVLLKEAKSDCTIPFPAHGIKMQQERKYRYVKGKHDVHYCLGGVNVHKGFPNTHNGCTTQRPPGGSGESPLFFSTVLPNARVSVGCSASAMTHNDPTSWMCIFFNGPITTVQIPPHTAV